MQHSGLSYHKIDCWIMTLQHINSHMPLLVEVPRKSFIIYFEYIRVCRIYALRVCRSNIPSLAFLQFALSNALICIVFNLKLDILTHFNAWNQVFYNSNQPNLCICIHFSNELYTVPIKVWISTYIESEPSMDGVDSKEYFRRSFSLFLGQWMYIVHWYKVNVRMQIIF